MKTARRFILSIFLSFKKVYLETCNVSDKLNKVLVSEGHNLHCNILISGEWQCLSNIGQNNMLYSFPCLFP